jgi:hypothetical protein
MATKEEREVCFLRGTNQDGLNLSKQKYSKSDRNEQVEKGGKGGDDG